MKTVPLSGKKAAGRVACVDDEDYKFVMQYRWRVSERAATATTRRRGPYAVTTIREVGHPPRTVGMHRLLTGWPLTDHIDHDGLNNQRYNLREATRRQNVQNSRGRIVKASRYKGVLWCRRRRMWEARIGLGDRKHRSLLFTGNQIEAAYAYDAAARELFGEFACTNFPGEPTEAMRVKWQQVRGKREAKAAARVAKALADGRAAWWARREPVTLTCENCGDEYQTRKAGQSRYCTPRCQQAGWKKERKAKQTEGRLF